MFLTIGQRPKGHTLTNSFVMSDLSDVGFRVRNRPPRSYFIRLIRVFRVVFIVRVVFKTKISVKAAIKREKSDACISFSEREQTRPKVKSVRSV